MLAKKSVLPLLLLLAACGSNSPKRTEPSESLLSSISQAAGESTSEAVEAELSEADREALEILGYLDDTEEIAPPAGDEMLQSKLASLQDRIAKANKRSAEISAQMAELDSSELIGPTGDALKAELEDLLNRINGLKGQVAELAGGAGS